jgi:hypothetical protein
MPHNDAQHISQAMKTRKRVRLYGTAGDVYQRGEGLAYNRDYGTAGDIDGRRDKFVERITTSNNKRFAGVLDHKVTIPQTGNIMIWINEPGSVCEVALGADTVINVGMLTAQAGGGDGAGRFVDRGFAGRGSMVPLQTVTAVLESNKAGTLSLAVDGITLTVADSSDMAAGDTVVFLASEDEGTSKTIVLGKHTIASITDATTVVLTATAVSATPAAALTCSGYIYNGNPTCMALLLDGEESGLVQWVSPPNAGGDSLAYMVGGVTYVNGGVTLAADSEVELAEETILGAKKGFVCMGTMTTSDFVIDLVTAGLQLDGSALAEINAIDAAADAAYLEWVGIWRTIGLVGGATEA